MQQGITGTVTAKTRTYLWQPWFAWLTGEIGLNVLRHGSDTTDSGSGMNNAPFNNNSTLTSKNLVTTGSMQLQVLQRTKFPFEAHYTKTDNRISGSLSALNGYASQTLGFTQNYATDYGNGMFGWDRSEQSGSASGNTQQDSLRLSLSKALTTAQNLQVNATRTDNRHATTGERAVQTNLNAQHKYAPDGELNIDTLANISKATYNLQQGRTDVDLMQLSSFGTWQPEDEYFTVTGGARLLAMANSASDGFFTGTSTGGRMRNANFNVGVGYEISSTMRATAGVNVNMASGMGMNSVTASQAVGIAYQPESRQLGDYRYDWSASANAINTSGQQQGRSLALQLSHGLSRSLQLGPGSGLTMAISQSLSSNLAGASGASQRLTHSGSVSWNMADEDGNLYLGMNASDSRSLGEKKESFQMINFQASSSMPAGRFGSLSGNLTIQATRQESPMFLLQQDQQTANAPKRGFVLNSSGSLSYQHSRVFGVPRLRFSSDLRLNGQAFLPMLGGPEDMETASWDNNLNYVIGRTNMRLSGRVAQLAGRKSKSIMFTVSRGLGDF